MALDPAIILQAGRGVTPLKSPQEIQEERAIAQMRQIQLQQAQQGMADDQAYRDVLSSGARGAELISQLQQRGLGKQAQQAQAFQLDQQKARAEQGKLVAEGMKNGAAAILANPTEQNAIATLEQARTQYGLPQEMVDGAKARIYAARNDPNTLRQLAVGWGGDAEKVLGKITSENLGGVIQQQRVNPLTGQVEVFGSQQKTATPGELLSAQTSTANNLRTVGASMRGQDMTDARAAQERAFKTREKPLPSSALKMQQESLDAIGTASAINADLNAIKQQIDGGKLSFGPVSNLASKARNAAGLSNEESRNFASFNATLEKLRNDSLRLNKGVQTDGDAQRAWNELFQNINDTKLVRQRLEEIERINQRAVQLRQLEIDQIRANYGLDPLETTQQRDQPSALNTPKADRPKTKALNMGGRDMMAELAPDGNYYVQQNGKWFRVKE